MAPLDVLEDDDFIKEVRIDGRIATFAMCFGVTAFK